ncbi:MAG TPA: hypothetical protein PLQ11_06755 [Beijerinckiaceae bacterium]|nr:hypothetical protein [Beijerinckiaceae bacterium]
MAVINRRLVLLAPLLLALPATAQQRWARYTNPKYGTSAEYPADLMQADAEPDARDGRTFRTPDGAALAIFGQFNVLSATPRSLEQDKRGEDDYREITYSSRGPNWFVLSGFRELEDGRHVFYEKYQFSADGGTIHALVLVYPETEKPRIDPLVRRIAASLKGP